MRGRPSAMTWSDASMTAASTQPPETDPANSLRAFTARRLPGLRGAEPHVSMTDASATPTPPSAHAASRPRTSACSLTVCPPGGGGQAPALHERRAGVHPPPQLRVATSGAGSSPAAGEGLWTRSAQRPPGLDRRHELIVDVPWEVDPLLLLELLHERVDDRPAEGLRVQRGEVGLGQELADRLGGAAGVDEVVDEEPAVAVALDRLEPAQLPLPRLRAAGFARAVAHHADRVDEADVELARHQRRRDEPAAGDGDDPLPLAEVVQDVRQVARVTVQLRPGDDDLVLVRVRVGRGGRVLGALVGGLGVARHRWFLS